MPDEFTLKVSLLGGVLVLVLVSLFVRRYSRSDPMVRAHQAHPLVSD